LPHRSYCWSSGWTDNLLRQTKWNEISATQENIITDEGNALVPDKHASWFVKFKFYHEAKKTKKGAQTPNKKRQKTPQRNNMERRWRISSKTILSLVLVNRRQTRIVDKELNKEKSTRETNFQTENLWEVKYQETKGRKERRKDGKKQGKKKERRKTKQVKKKERRKKARKEEGKEENKKGKKQKKERKDKRI